MDAHGTYNDLLRRHAAVVWSMCRDAAQGDDERCRDLFQDVAVRLWIHLGELRHDAQPHEERAWVEWQTRHILEHATRRIRPTPTENLPEQADEKEAADAEVRATVDDLLAQLQPNDRMLVQMRLDGYSAEEIATKMGISRDSVYQRWHRIVTLLRKLLVVLLAVLLAATVAVAVVPQWRHAVFSTPSALDTVPETQDSTALQTKADNAAEPYVLVDWNYLGPEAWVGTSGHGMTFNREARTVTFFRNRGGHTIKATMYNVPDIYFDVTQTHDSMSIAKQAAASAAIMVALATATQAQVAHDFQSVTPQGDTLFCTITDSAQHHISVRGDEAVWNTPYIRYNDTVIIPSNVEHNGEQYTVTALADSAFYSHNEVHAVDIPPTVTAIGHLALSGTQIVELTVPDDVDTIGQKAFNLVKNVIYHGTATGAPWGALTVNAYEEDGLYYSDSTRTRVTGCRPGMTQALLPASVRVVGRYAFSGITTLATVNLPEGLDTIGKSAFQRCSQLESIVIPSTVKHIDKYAFYSAFKEDGSSTVTIANALCSIGNGAFAYSYVGNVDMGDSVVSIGSDAFSSCNKIDSIIVPNSCTYIAPRAFCYNYNNRLKKVHLPEGLDSIRDELLHGCTNLREVNIPESVVYIGEMALAELFYVNNITLPAGLTYIGPWALGNCTRVNRLTSLASVPPQVCNNSFEGMSSGLQLTVPCHSSEAYYTDPNWSYFQNIEEDCSPVPDIEVSEITISSGDGCIIVNSCNEETIRVMDIEGRTIAEIVCHSSCAIPLPSAGVYLVQVGNQTARKVILP